MRARGMQVLTNQVKAWRPGVTVYGIGDAAHKLEVSGHNEDDTAGVRAEDQDPDNVPEHRAIDVMLGPSFTAADADALVAALAGNAANQRRLLYVVWNRSIWSRSRGWVRAAYTGSNPHTDHVHVSGEADQDDNTAGWALPILTGDDMAFGNDERANLKATDERVRQALILGEAYQDDDPAIGVVTPWIVKAVNGLVDDVAALKTGVDIVELVEALRPVIREEIDKTQLGSK